VIYRPATIRVEILPPIETNNWSAETIDEHMNSVRDMFLQTLGQDRAGHIVAPLKVVEN
jgi:putative phosphoserine phosphatase/1-acylglycerol-3-phosphate O-acyltransferase